MSTSTSTQPQPATASIADQALPLFARSVLNLLHIWPALRIALTQGWGNSQSVTILAEDIVDLFYTVSSSDSAPQPLIHPTTGECHAESPDRDDVEDVLIHVLSHAFGLTLEDGSEVQVAGDLIKLWVECVRRTLYAQAGQPLPPSGSNEGEGMLETFERAAQKAKQEDGMGVYQARREGGDEISDDEDDGEEDSDEEMGELINSTSAGAAEPSTRRQEPEIDEDGFQLVTKKGGRR